MESNAARPRGATADVVVVGRKSWVAYVPPVLSASLVSLGAAVFTVSQNAWIGVAVYSTILTLLAYRLAVIRSHQMFYDSAGVWIRSGVLPWDRGLSGVKWRDLDEAVYRQSFWSWLLRTHTVTLRHRYTKSQEIQMRQCANGSRVSAAINEVHLHAIDPGAVG